MKILSITEFTTAEGTGKDTTLELDTRSGVFFRLVTGTFETPYFTLNQQNIPVMMFHGDREQRNVQLQITGNTLTINQGYRLASHGFLFAEANDDWVDSNELKSVIIDATEIESVKLNNGSLIRVVAGLSGTKIRLTSFGYTPTAATYYTWEVITKDGNNYIIPLQWSSHQTNNNPITYDYFTIEINRALTVYSKP